MTTLSITTASPLAKTKVGDVKIKVEATGGTAPYVFALDGAPTWLLINTATGEITGKAPKAETLKFKVKVKDAATPPAEAEKAFEWLIEAAAAPTRPVTPPAPRQGTNLWLVAGLIVAAIAIVVLLGMFLARPSAEPIDANATVQVAIGQTQTAAPTQIATAIPTNTKVATATNAPATATEVGAPTNPATATQQAQPTAKPTEVPHVAAGQVVYNPPANSFAGVANGKTVSISYVLNEEGPAEVITSPQGFTTVVCGSCTVDGVAMTTDKKGTIGNVYIDVCRSDEDCSIDVTGYVAGNVGVTTSFPEFETPAETAFNAIVGLFSAPNCGQNGCLVANLYVEGSLYKSFTSAPAQTDIVIEPTSGVETLIMGVPVAESRAIELNGKIIGHSYTIEGTDLTVSIPEGGSTIFVCEATQCKINDNKLTNGEVAWFKGWVSDGATPKDLNFVVKASGQMDVAMVYGNVSSLTVIKAMTKGLVLVVDPDGTTEKILVEDLK